MHGDGRQAPASGSVRRSGRCTYELLLVQEGPRRFLSTAFSDQHELLSGLDIRNDYKWDTVTRITDRLRSREGQLRDFTVSLLLTLADFDDRFPHPAKLDDGLKKVAAARSALARITRLTASLSREIQGQAARQQALAEAAAEDKQGGPSPLSWLSCETSSKHSPRRKRLRLAD